jgi:quercetin dioxygenase-like cupin family protein
MDAQPHATRIERVEVKRDARGEVYEPLAAGEAAALCNVHVVTSRPGAVRGNHVHRHGTEILTVAGPALVRLRESDDLRDIDVPAGEVFRFTIPPGTAHAVRNTGEFDQVLVSFNTEGYDAAAPDVVRDVVIE